MVGPWSGDVGLQVGYLLPWACQGDRQVVHGIKNTGATPLTFVVMKWNTKGVAIPPAPGNK